MEVLSEDGGLPQGISTVQTYICFLSIPVPEVK